MKMKMLGVVGMLLAGTGLLHAQLRDPMPGWIYPAVAPNRAAAYDPPMDHYGYPTYPARQPVLAYPSDPAASPFVMPARQTGSGVSLVDQPVQSELVQVVPSEPAPTAVAGQESAVLGPEVGMPATADSEPDLLSQADPCANANRCWASAEFLLWWIKDGPLPVPLLTTSAPADIGVLGRPTTAVLFGGQPLDFGSLPGVRTTVGAWLDSDRIFGMEASGFLLERRSVLFNGSTIGALGSPVLAVPFVHPDGTQGSIVFGGSSAVPLANGNNVAGAFGIDAHTRLWGAEAGGVLSLFRDARWNVVLLSGFRYLDLDESLASQVAETFFVIGPTNTSDALDSFRTRNQFYGGQIGGRVEYQFGRWDLGILGSIGLGSTHQVVDIQGFRADVGPRFPPLIPAFRGGYFYTTIEHWPCYPR